MHLRVPSFSWHRKSKTILWKQRLLKAKEKEFHTIVLQVHLQPVWPGTAATRPTSLGGLGNTRQMTCNPSKPKFKHHRNPTKQTRERTPSTYHLHGQHLEVASSSKRCSMFSSVSLYVHKNRRFIRDGSPGRPPLGHSSWALFNVDEVLLSVLRCQLTY